ncbi:endogenous inhibitor of DNA gyrase (YacG/DUF329 family) [Azospirillum fermentarium]|uniref:DNA gyrase inhibitor YacG n=1 Tax=Azospirillum fermentarium TaxID=1233114 RepID=UPI0022273286|nr:DNA gyrase inhibitor YacG [Azospirillum fermentarium]MCW2248257.1 endogenous inhibitor of DNA gyrase (YacG/DUF329 family) [Azospirillum fermentarium]
MTKTAETPALSPVPACPVCGRPAAAETRPFCSRRCADVDLARWLGGVYRVETDERADENFDG